LINIGTTAEPVWVHEQPMITALFSRINCENCVESVWSWNVPFSTKDYIVDPAEGLWDEPGWLRYFPEGSAGPDGDTRTFLTDLVTMHANTGYLVKMAADLAAPVTLSVEGLSVVDGQQWVKDSYNLAGFPVLPGSGPTVSIYFGGSPITEARYLTSDGYWEKLTDTDTLNNAQSYLVYYDGDVYAPDGFTPPLNMPEPVTAEVPFAPGTGGQRQEFPVENPTDQPIEISLGFAESSDVPLYFEDDTQKPTEYIDLRTNTVTLTLAPGELRILVVYYYPNDPPAQNDPPPQGDALPPGAHSGEDPGQRKAVLVIASLDGGTRWMIPMVFESPDLTGLWVGDGCISVWGKGVRK